MPDTRLKCPSCEAVLRLLAPVAPGKTIKCPKCAATIRAPAAAGKSAGPAGGSIRPAPRPQPARKARPAEEPDEEVEEAEEVEELEDEEEAPRPRKAARRAADDEDEDEDFDDRPRKRRKRPKKKKGNPALLWGLIGGGVGLLLVVVVVLFATGVIGPKKGKKLAAEIVGKWELQQAGLPGTTIFEFKKDGTVTVTVSALGQSQSVSGTYKVLSDDEIDMRAEIRGRKSIDRATVTINGDEMTIESGGLTLHFKRVK